MLAVFCQNRNMKKFLIIFLSLFLCGFVFFGNLGLAKTPFEKNLESTGKETGHLDSSGGGGKTVDEIIQKIINTVLSFLGVGFLVLMIYGGYVWMTARGNEQEVGKAKNIITNAIIGLVIVLSAYAISYFIVSTFVDAPQYDESPIDYEE